MNIGRYNAEEYNEIRQTIYNLKLEIEELKREPMLTYEEIEEVANNWFSGGMDMVYHEKSCRWYIEPVVIARHLHLFKLSINRKLAEKEGK